MSHNVATLNEIEDNGPGQFNELKNEFQKSQEKTNVEELKIYPILLGVAYGLPLAFGGYLWQMIYSKALVKYRKKLNIKLLNWIIRLLGVVLIFLGFYLAYKAVLIFLA